MTSNPYRIIDAPALISFSGGRTSAFMLRQILDAHGGTLPGDIRVAFENTGKEREETLRFVQACSDRWSVPIHWLEWRDNDLGFAEVTFETASRDGEPFSALIAKKGYLPNRVARYCTVELKVRVMRDFARSLGWKRFFNVIGLRADEGLRVLNAKARNGQNKEPWKVLTPIAEAGHSKRDVLAFWGEQPFDLGLRSYEGNCDLCFLKTRGKLEAVIRENPGIAVWWADQERRTGTRFHVERSMAELVAASNAQTHLFGVFDGDEHDAECGIVCGREIELEAAE